MPGPIIFEVDVQIAITLACIGYLAEGGSPAEKYAAMGKGLRQPDLPTAGRWRIVWGPAEADSSLWYMAVGPDGQGQPALAVVIRGTQMKLPASLKLDRELELVPLPFEAPTAPPDARISKGFAQELRNLLVAVDPQSGLTGEQFLRKLTGAPGAPRQAMVIGHSLGGATAPILSMWLKQQFPALAVRPFPFGGQSPGNQAFAHWYEAAIAPWPSRYTNRLDATWMMFAEFQQMKTLWPGGPSCPPWLTLLIDAVEIDMAARKIRYASTQRPRIFEGALYDLSGLGAWEKEASAQHEHLYYMFLAGIPLQVIRNGLGPQWSPPPILGTPPG